MTKTCLDLFAGMGGFSQAFAESDAWEVVEVELDPQHNPDIQANIFDLKPSDLPESDVILASPPCTQFSSMAWSHEKQFTRDGEPLTEDASESVALVYHTLGLIKALNPDYWFMENPKGALRWVIGEPTNWVSYCQYGKDYRKDTGLWGNHAPGMHYRKCQNNGCHVSNTSDDGTSAIASMDVTNHAERSKCHTNSPKGSLMLLRADLSKRRCAK